MSNQENKIHTNDLNEELKSDFSSDNEIADPNFEMPSVSSDDSLSYMGAQIENSLQQEDSFQLTDTTIKNTGALKPNSKKEIKRKRNSGKSYISKRGKLVSYRKFLPLSICKKLCMKRITHNEQKSLFDKYWALNSYEKRVLYISGNIELARKLSQKLNKSEANPKNRENTIYYHVEINGNKINVCKICFMKCFGESPGFLRSVTKKKLTSNFTEGRGKAVPKNKLDENKIKSIKNHILSFPAYESHYSRRDTAKKYLSSDLSIAKMFQLYCSNDANPKISITKYAEIFHSQNLKFKSPKIDTCNKCDILKAKLDFTEKNLPEYEVLKLQQTEHHIEADLAYKTKEIDKNLSKSNISMKTFTFDLQQCLPTPYLNANVSYYKRKLFTYNLTIHDCETNEAFNHIWHEAEGKKGANEISSCLFFKLNSLAANVKIDTLILYSDSCAGQNKNSYVSAMFILLLQIHSHIKTIEHKFLAIWKVM